MSTLRVNTLQNAAGTGQPAMSGAAKAWVNFNGTGTVAIRAAFNVTSITDNGTGDYTVNFTTALQDADYVVVGTCFATNVGDNRGFIANSGNASYAPTSSAMRFCSVAVGVGNFDYPYEYISIFR